MDLLCVAGSEALAHSSHSHQNLKSKSTRISSYELASNGHFLVKGPQSLCQFTRNSINSIKVDPECMKGSYKDEVWVETASTLYGYV